MHLISWILFYQASPHVAGVGALYLESDPTLTGAQVKSRIVNAGVKNTVSDPQNSANVLLNTEDVSGFAPLADNTTSAASGRCIWGW
jgi:subtilisin family serine protease